MESQGSMSEIEDRGLSLETAQKYGVTVERDSDGKIVKHFFPHHNAETAKLQALKSRFIGKNDKKAFSWSGDRDGCGLFGQKACKPGGKYLTITEGEFDAMAADQIFGNRFDFVSLNDGSGGAVRDVQNNLEFIESYDTVVLCFDNDDAGRKCVDSVKELISPGKLKIVSLPKKDANEMLLSRQSKAFQKAWWDAKPYQPDGLVNVLDTWDAVLEFRNTPSLPYPWPGLDDMLLGLRTAEIVTIGAPTGIGKTTFMRELQDSLIHLIPEDERVGCMMLEESVAKTTLGWMSFKANRPLHREMRTLSEEQLRKYWEQASHGGKYVLLDHLGWRNNLDTLKSRMRYMRRALNCRWIVLDHLHIALSSVAGASGDWSGIDELMTEFRSVVHELDIGLLLVSHTSGEDTFRGSKGIGQLSDVAIFLERDKHAEGEAANITKVKVDKNRWAGDVGTACYLRYDKSTGRLKECDPDHLEESMANDADVAFTED